RNLKAKGQAFIVFSTPEEAASAIEEVQGFELFGKPVVLDFAKTRSDKTVEQTEGPDGLEVHKRHRMAEKERKQALEAAAAQKRKAPPTDPLTSRGPAKSAKTAGGLAANVVPDEYLPPNKILFLRQLPDSYSTEEAGKTALQAIFSRFPGFKEVRLVPGRKGIAFVEYAAEEGAIAAKERTAGMVLGEEGKAMKVTFQRQ
ncbi:hypothetical protein LTR28_012825, partial [Elasticomyces elasticus]